MEATETDVKYFDTWRSSIFFSDWTTRRVAGHSSIIPEKGDILRCKMESGKIALFQFETIERMMDPKDQFFATVSDLTYES